MPFINNTVTASTGGNISFFTAKPDVSTFCPVNVTLSATVIGNLSGHTVRWEQLLKYTYIASNPSLKQITVAGNVAATFYSNREIITVINTNNGSGIGTYTVINAFYNGINTILTTLQSLPNSMGSSGVFTHAGSATSNTTWITPQNQVTVQYTPSGGADGSFRFWIDRGSPAQRYSDMDVFLTPGEVITRAYSADMDNNPVTFPSCRLPAAFLLPADTYGSCDDGGESVVTNWLLQWATPACDSSLVTNYQVQSSMDGGETWTTIGTYTAPTAVAVPLNSIVRIVTRYGVPGIQLPVVYEGPYGGLLDYYFTVTTYPVVQYITPTNNELYGHDSHCLAVQGGDLSFDPISNYTFTELTALYADWNNFPDLDDNTTRAFGGNFSADPISNYLFTPLTALYADWNNFPDLDDPGTTRAFGGNFSTNPISNYTVTGSGIVIGG